MKARIWIGLGATLLLVLCLMLYFLWPYMFWYPKWPFEPRIIGLIDIDAGMVEGEWVVSPSSNVSMELVFETEKGAAKGLSIIFDLGDLDLIHASANFTMREGRYAWRFAAIRGNEVGRIRLTATVPEIEGVRYQIHMWYAYINEDIVLIDSHTILGTFEPS